MNHTSFMKVKISEISAHPENERIYSPSDLSDLEKSLSGPSPSKGTSGDHSPCTHEDCGWASTCTVLYRARHGVSSLYMQSSVRWIPFVWCDNVNRVV